MENAFRRIRGSNYLRDILAIVGTVKNTEVLVVPHDWQQVKGSRHSKLDTKNHPSERKCPNADTKHHPYTNRS